MARDNFEPRLMPLYDFWHVRNDTDETPTALQLNQGMIRLVHAVPSLP